MEYIYGSYPIKIALLGGIVGFVVMYIAFKIVKGRVSKKALIYDIELTMEGKKIVIKAMLDTGNMLKDPITKTPVVVVERECLYGMLPNNILNNIEKIIGGEWKESDDTAIYRARFRIIPYSSIGKKNGMLLGFKIDELKVITDVNEVVRKNVIMCIHNDNLSRTNTYSALIGLDMLEGSDESEYITNVKV